MVGYIISKTPKNPKKILNRAKVLNTFVSRVKLVENSVNGERGIKGAKIHCPAWGIDNFASFENP